MRVVGQVGGALDAIHGIAGLVHRDVKPSNVLIRDVGGSDHAYLTDFGVAKRSDAAGDLTATGMVVGTVDYMAPEQIRGGRADARTDVYALGCVFFEMLTGRVPYERDNSVAKLFAHVSDPPPRLEGPVAQQYPAFGPVLEKAMAKNPDDRYLSAGDLARDADAALHGMRYMGAPSIVAVGEAKPSPAAHHAPGEVPTLPDPARLATLRHTHERTAAGPPTPLPPPGAQTPAAQPAVYYGYGPPAPASAPPASRGSPLALILLALVALAGIAVGVLAVAGVFSHQTSTGIANSAARAPSRHATASTRANSSSSGTTTPATTSPSSQPSSPTYNGQAFSISYPSGWQIQDAEQDKGSYTDTTIVSPSDSNTLLRVDYSPNPPNSPLADARIEINSLQDQPGYKQLELSSGTFQGNPAERWKFLVIESGVLLEKEDLFFNADNGSRGFGVLTQAPASEYPALAPQFAQLRQSLVVK